ncbi:MAG: rhodanese-like domain-containing protein [Smithellaceae bacterium]
MKCKRTALMTLLAFSLGVAGFAEAQTGAIAPVSVQTVKSWMASSEASLTLIDGRSLLECLDAKIPQAVCWPCDTTDDAFLSSLPEKSKIIFYSGNRPTDPECAAIKQVLASGNKNVYGLEGGFAAWRKEAYPVVSEKRTPRVTAPAVSSRNLSRWRKQAKNPLILDIRKVDDFAAGHLDGAMNLPLSRLHIDYASIPLTATLLVADEDGTQSFLAASYLFRKGFMNVQRLKGGMIEYRRRTP